ncbi:MAG: glycosyltransferase [Lachnospiraceae bacterium]|nr:glycosyltransferase [Lachnospiraceae bacterium]
MDIHITEDNILSSMKDFCHGKLLDVGKLEALFIDYMKNDNEYIKQCAQSLAVNGLNIAQYNIHPEWYYFLMSFLLYATNEQSIYKELLIQCIKDNNISKESKFFIYQQLIRYDFFSKSTANSIIRDMQDDLYNIIYQSYKNELKSEMQFIPKHERNKDFVIVLSTQVLMLPHNPNVILHGPTKMMLNCCHLLKNTLKKQVYVINTAESLSSYCAVPWFNQANANYIENLCNREILNYNGNNIPFYQCPNKMPDVYVINELLNVIKSEKPYFICTIGGDSIVNDLCSNLVPTLSIPLSANRVTTYGQFQTMGREMSDDDKQWLKKHNLPKEHIIEINSSYVFEKPIKSLTRSELGIPDNQFNVVLVGTRLDDEIDNECINILYKLTDNNIFVTFIGKFNKYKEFADSNEKFMNNTLYMGYQDNLNAIYECCDIYMNPKRLGGGTSAAEALYTGLPVVSFDFGDIGSIVGSDFHVHGYSDMFEHIIKYSTDNKYYDEMSKRAKQRAATLDRSESNFLKILQKMEESQLL